MSQTIVISLSPDHYSFLLNCIVLLKNNQCPYHWMEYSLTKQYGTGNMFSLVFDDENLKEEERLEVEQWANGFVWGLLIKNGWGGAKNSE